MQAGAESVRRDLAFGAVFGLGLSAAGWALVLSPPATEPAFLALVGLGSVAGIVRVRLPRAGRVSLLYALVLVTLLRYGIGSSVLAGTMAAAMDRWIAHGAIHGRRDPLRSAFHVGMAANTAVAAALAFAAAHTFWPAPSAFPIALHAVAFALALMLHQPLGRSIPALPKRPGRVRRDALRSAAEIGLGVAVAIPVAAAYAIPAARPWLLAPALLFLAEFARHSRVERQRRRRKRPQEATGGYMVKTRSIARTLARRLNHSEEQTWRVQLLALALAERMELPDAEMQPLASAALLHDIGKIAVPPAIRDKTGALSAEETAWMRMHPINGSDLLQAIDFPLSVQSIVRHHNECWDGTGHPDRLRGRAIPLGARILAATECYDGLICGRRHRRAVGPTEAQAHLRAESGSRFDPWVIDSLLEHLRERGATSHVNVPLDGASLLEAPDAIDALTGLPDSRFLREELHERITRNVGVRFGLVGFRASGLVEIRRQWGAPAADERLKAVASRVAGACTPHENLVRFGPDLFVVLTPIHRSGDLVNRWHRILSDTDVSAIAATTGAAAHTPLVAAHASYPDDAGEPDDLLRVLESRLDLAVGPTRTVVPFRRHGQGS